MDYKPTDTTTGRELGHALTAAKILPADPVEFSITVSARIVGVTEPVVDAVDAVVRRRLGGVLAEAGLIPSRCTGFTITGGTNALLRVTATTVSYLGSDVEEKLADVLADEMRKSLRPIHEGCHTRIRYM